MTQINCHREWRCAGILAATLGFGPKQLDFRSINVEDVAFRSSTEMVFGLGAPLVTRVSGNALYYKVTNIAAFLPAGGGWSGVPQGLTGPHQLNLNGQGIRCIEWCDVGLTNASGVAVQRYLIIGGPANGGPLEKDQVDEKFSLYSWDGQGTPVKLIDNLRPYTIRPEGIELINMSGQWRVLFVEDRFQSTGYATRNAINWPVSILGNIP